MASDCRAGLRTRCLLSADRVQLQQAQPHRQCHRGDGRSRRPAARVYGRLRHRRCGRRVQDTSRPGDNRPAIWVRFTHQAKWDCRSAARSSRPTVDGSRRRRISPAARSFGSRCRSARAIALLAASGVTDRLPKCFPMCRVPILKYNRNERVRSPIFFISRQGRASAPAGPMPRRISGSSRDLATDTRHSDRRRRSFGARGADEFPQVPRICGNCV